MDDHLKPDSEEELLRNPVYYEPGRCKLDLDRPDLGVPQGQELLAELLRMRGRVPVEHRGLICPDCRDLRNRRVPMYLVQRDDVLLVSHYRRPGEERISHESDEHLARKERVAEDAEDHGFSAEMESTTPGGSARLDVRIQGDNGLILGYEPQLSSETGGILRRREAHRRRANVRSIWDFTNPDHNGVGAVPYVRTPDLPASVIRAGMHPIEVRDGNFVLEEGHCSPGGAIMRCPGKPYDPANPTAAAYCGLWHRILTPAHQSDTVTGEGLTLTQFIVEAAAGERVPFRHSGQHGWLPRDQWEWYLEANGPDSSADVLGPKSFIRPGDRRDRCTEDRPDSEVRAEPKEQHRSRTIVLETREVVTPVAEAVVEAPVRMISPCRFCREPASLLNRDGMPEHWTCRRRAERSGMAA